MKKELITLVLLLLLVFLASTVAESADPVMDEDTFVRELAKALETNDQARMGEIIRAAGLMAYEMVIYFTDKGIMNVSQGKDGFWEFNRAELFAIIYAKEFKKDGLYELVRRYKFYDQEMCRERLKGSQLIDEGISLYKKGQWNDALNRWTEALKIFEKLDDTAYEAKALNNIGIFYGDLGQYIEALEHCQHALEIYRRIGNVAGEAIALNNIGKAYLSLGQYTEALKYSKEALEIYRSIGDMEGETAPLNGIGIVYYSLGQYTEALKYSKEAREIHRKVGDMAGEAKPLINIGNVYNSLGQYTEALKHYKEALEIYKRIGDVAGEAKALNNIGNVYYSLGQYTEALKHCQHALEIDRRIGNVGGEANAYINIGGVYDSLGQYTEALKYYNQALEISRKIGNVGGEANALGNIGGVYDSLRQYTEALKYYKDALEIQRRIGDVAGEAKALGNIGNAYVGLGQYTEALKYYNQTLEISRKIGNVAGEANALGNIGNVYYNFGQYTEALKYYKDALEIQRRIGDVAGEAKVLNNIGNAYNSLGHYGDAVKPLKQSLEISVSLGELEIVWRGARTLGMALWKSGKLEEAVSSFKKSIDSIEEIYTYTKGLKEEERASMIVGKRFVYQDFTELLLELHCKSPDKGYDKEAFVISEKAKSRIFQELMAKAGAKTVFAGDEIFQKMIQREQKLIGEITNLRQNLIKELSKPEKDRNEEVIRSLKEQLAKAENALNDHEKEMELNYPRYADLKRPKPLTVEELQNILKPGETLLAYSVGKDKLISFVIGKKKFRLAEIEIGREELTTLIKDFRRGLDNIYSLRDLESFKPDISYALYQKIFLPVSNELKGISRLYISADDLLYTLPFEALVDREFDYQAFREVKEKGKRGEGDYLGEYAKLHYLIDTCTITYLPSASVLRSLRGCEKPGFGRWSKSLIAYADPIFSLEETKTGEGTKQKGINKETEFILEILKSSTGVKLERLKETAQEAEAITQEVGGKEEDIYLREKATEENVYITDLKKARYLLFSTHGLLGGDFSGVAEPSLVLTLVDNPPGRDGFLTMSEVLGLDLNAELVVLSACNTYGRGDKAGSGEGFAGLTRSFMYAGSRSLLVTHWSVESQAARDLMVETFKNIKKGSRPDALREAKLRIKGSTRPMGKTGIRFSLSHPFFWAPFVLVGEGE
jgi:tetratricopeptide (TPR) repeat protein/CHAT domain-containing protein